jgi:hypothetical protein
MFDTDAIAVPISCCLAVFCLFWQIFQLMFPYRTVRQFHYVFILRPTSLRGNQRSESGDHLGRNIGLSVLDIRIRYCAVPRAKHY